MDNNEVLRRLTIHELSRVDLLLERLSLSVFGKKLNVFAYEDKVFGDEFYRRIYLQVEYEAPCTKTHEIRRWSGRKWYLSSHMTDDEVIKTAYAAFKAAVEHEVMEGFKVDGIVLFNPHISFEELLKVSHKEVSRTKIK